MAVSLASMNSRLVSSQGFGIRDNVSNLYPAISSGQGLPTKVGEAYPNSSSSLERPGLGVLADYTDPLCIASCTRGFLRRSYVRQYNLGALACRLPHIVPFKGFLAWQTELYKRIDLLETW